MLDFEDERSTSALYAKIKYFIILNLLILIAICAKLTYSVFDTSVSKLSDALHFYSNYALYTYIIDKDIQSIEINDNYQKLLIDINSLLDSDNDIYYDVNEINGFESIKNQMGNNAYLDQEFLNIMEGHVSKFDKNRVNLFFRMNNYASEIIKNHLYSKVINWVLIVFIVIDMMLLYMLYRGYINEKKTLSSRAYSDFLTKLPNKRMFDKYVNNLPQNSSISIVVLDVDDFKSYNDLYGHQKGDVALEEIGVILNEHMQNNVIFFRVGGEEFAGLFVSKSHNQVRQVLESICLKLQDKSIEHDGNINHKIITLSIGVAWGKISTPLDMQNLYDDADKMLYTSKRQGKNRITFKESSV